jgi:hypothetical protein
MNKLILFLVIFMPLFSFSQRLKSVEAFGTTSDEEGIKMIHTKDNGYLLVGRTYYPGNSRYFVKLDSNFNKVWEKKTPSYKYFIWDIIETFNNEYLVVGYYADTDGISTYPFMQKLNYSGDTLWTRVFHQWGGDTYFDKCIQLSDSSYLLRFYFGPMNKNLANINDRGNIKWNIRLTPGAMLNINDSFIAWTNSTYFKKYTYDGKLVLDTSIKLKHGVGKIIPLIEGGYVFFGSGLGISKLTFNGDTLWSKYYTENNIVYAADVKETLDSGFLALGTLNDDIYLLKTDKNGNKQWSYVLQRPFETETAYGLALNCDSSITIFEDATNGSIGGKDLFLLTIDSMPNVYGRCVIRSGIESEPQPKGNISLFPNPVQNEVQLKFDNLFTGRVNIYNSIGGNVISQPVKNLFQISLPLKILPPGLYLIAINDESNKVIYTDKIIKN